MNKGLRRTGGAVLIAVLVAAMPAAAAERPGRAAGQRMGLAAEVGIWLGGLLGRWELLRAAPPGGFRAVSGQHGLTIDPNGIAAVPPGPSPESQSNSEDGDHGLTIDPNG